MPSDLDIISDITHTILIYWGIIIITCSNKGSTSSSAKVSPTVVLFKSNQNKFYTSLHVFARLFILKLNKQNITPSFILNTYIMNPTSNCIPYSSFGKFHLAGKSVQLQMPDLPQVWKAQHHQRKETWNSK